MRSFHKRDNEIELVAARDLLTGLIALILMLLLLMALMFNPKKKEDDKTPQSRGTIQVEITWPDQMDVDIDLWCKAPGDHPVGYSNRGGAVFDLVRDDLGKSADLMGINYEIIYGRGNPPGEYICNVHWFNNKDKAKEVPVKMVVTIRRNDTGANIMKVIETNAVLDREGEEITMVRWRITPAGEFDPTSVNAVFRPLRAAPSSPEESR